MNTKKKPSKRIEKLSDVSWEGRTTKNIVQNHIKLAKAKTRPSQRDMVAIHLIKILTKKIQAQACTKEECSNIIMEWNRYIEYAGEHELHDAYSFELNVYALLVSGLYGKELYSQIRKVTRQARVLGWDKVMADPLEVYRHLLYEEHDARVFIVDRLESDEALAYTVNHKIDKELMKEK